MLDAVCFRNHLWVSGSLSIVPRAGVKRQCKKSVEGSVLQAIEEFIRKTRTLCNTNGQCTAKNVQHILAHPAHNWVFSGPKPEVILRLYNNLAHARAMLGMTDDSVPAAEQEPAD